MMHIQYFCVAWTYRVSPWGIRDEHGNVPWVREVLGTSMAMWQTGWRIKAFPVLMKSTAKVSSCFFLFVSFFYGRPKKNKSSTTARFSTTCVAERMPRKKESFCSFTNQKMTFFWKLKMTFFPSLLDSPVLCFSCMDVQATIFFKMNNKMQNRNTASQRCSWKLEWDNFIKLLRYKGLVPWNAGWSLSTVAVIWMLVKRVYTIILWGRAWHGRILITNQSHTVIWYGYNIIHLDNFGRHLYVHQGPV